MKMQQNSDKINVAILTSSNSRNGGGVSEVITQLSNVMKDEIKDYCVVSYCDEFSASDLKKYDGVKMYFYKKSNIPLLSKIGYSNNLKQIINKIAPNIIDCQGLWMYFSFIALNYKLKHKAKIVITPHGMLDEWAVKNSRWRKKIIGYLYEYKNLRNANCIKALCKPEYESIRKFGLKNPIAIIPNGINLPADFNYERKTCKKTLLYIGRIHPKKGLKELIEAIALVKKQKPDLLLNWHVRIAGWDQLDHSKELTKLTAEKGLDDTIEFIGPVFDEKKKHELCEANAFALTSYSEGFPMSILEAWSYRLPVIMTDNCNIPEGFKYNAAIRVELSPNSIAKGLMTLFQMHDSELKSMGNNGYNLVKEQYTWEIVAKKTKELYQWLTDEGEKPDFVITE